MFAERETKDESKYLYAFNARFHLIEQYLQEWHVNKADYTVSQCILLKYCRLNISYHILFPSKYIATIL